MNINTVEIEDSTGWDAFVTSLAPNTFLQSWAWGVVQKATGEDVIHLGLLVDNVQVGAVQIVVVRARRGVFLLIPHGPLLKPEYTEAGMEAVVAYCRTIAAQYKAVAIRIAPLLETTPANEALFTKLGFRPAPMHIHAELTWVLPIAPAEDVLLAQMRKTTRHAIRKAEKAGVQVDIVTGAGGLDRFWPLYEATKDRHGFVPFSRAALQAEYDAFAQADAVFIPIASVGGKDVAGAIIVCYGNVAFYHHGASLKLSSDTPAAQYLHWKSIQYAKQRGATSYNFWGIAPDGFPKHPFAGITTFKKGFGGFAIDYMHAQDLPLSPGYWKLWLVDTWRKWRRGF